MKRFHVHVAVTDLADSIRFYTALFAAEPTVVKGDYAKWMLDDPRINFAISQRGAAPGLDHLGVQVESEAELAEMHVRLQDAQLPVDEQIGTACVILGGGRERKEDSVDPAVGIVLHKKVGDQVAAGEPLATLYYNAEAQAARARQWMEASWVVTDAAPSSKRQLIHRVIGKFGEKH